MKDLGQRPAKGQVRPIPADPRLKILRDAELMELTRLSEAAKLLPPLREVPIPIPDHVDYSPQIPFIRHQGGWGCFMYARAACWDIMNELACPYSPNLSVNRMLWAFTFEVIHKWPIPGLGGYTYATANQYLMSLGCPTESTEFTDSDGVRWPMPDGDDEAPNFRMKGTGGILSPLVSVGGPVSVDVNSLRYHLASHPLWVVVDQNRHFVALVGYNDRLQRFKLLNSIGDQFEDNGFYYIAYADLKKEVQAADYCEFVPPKPMPVARIRLTSQHRQDVFLWLANEKTTWTKRVWPNGQRQDDSRNLAITVTLPSRFQWPPTDDFPLHLEVFSTTEHVNAGGEVLEYTVANGANDVMPCKQLANGPVHFDEYQLLKLTIP
jgi:hypothetical protein